ncbi:hypothetical protein KUL106_33670 [Alteromonas sp. KUL106]|nr:hypothetical protein KUL106_33670 [Alteromonas sp. KUL106]
MKGEARLSLTARACAYFVRHYFTISIVFKPKSDLPNLSISFAYREIQSTWHYVTNTYCDYKGEYL